MRVRRLPTILLGLLIIGCTPIIAAQTPWESQGLTTCAPSGHLTGVQVGTLADSGEALAFRYIGSYPADCMTGWGVDLQGVTHDSLHWYFTQKDVLWRFPVKQDLGQFITSPDEIPGVRRVALPAVLRLAGYNHFGAPAYHQGLLLIPLEGRRSPGIAVFRAADLSYRGSLLLPGQHGAGWLAVRPLDDRLYSSNSVIDSTRGLLAYTIDWAWLATAALPSAPDTLDPRFQLRPGARILLADQDSTPIHLVSMQGGGFTADDQLFTVNGFCEALAHDTGISGFVIRGERGYRVSHSYNRPGPEAFQFHVGHPGLFWCREEPEGLTIWELNDGRAPNIAGNLHVLMVNNAPWAYGAWYLRHYQLGR
jgi:hypothetical protein